MYINHLSTEKSPYLLQHAHNPVNWYPWGEEAFTIAKEKDLPIFLSIGYSTCHWCHVMAEESFEDSEIASLMNETFVNIKVDREERPDIDDTYMSVAQLLTGQGGWPLTIIMTYDKKPFFAGTYIPKMNRFGLIGMKELIPQIQKIWKTRRTEIINSADQITNQLKKFYNEKTSAQEIDDNTLKTARNQLLSLFDSIHGGFGNAPKFPTPHNLIYLLRYWKRTNDPDSLEIVEKSLMSMRLGGIYDHVGFGFHRYSTDSQWIIPHFEKMLYDQALLTMAYCEAFQITKKQFYNTTIKETLQFVSSELLDPQGGFYSALDADSEGAEGKFYVWTIKEIHEVLPQEEAQWVIKRFNLTQTGNFQDHTHTENNGQNVLYLNKLEISESFENNNWEPIRKKLFAARENRIHPNKDDKVLTDWNGLMIAAYAKAGRILQEQSYVTIANNAVNFILNNMRTGSGELLHRYRDKEAALPAFLDDYAFFIMGLLELYESSFNINLLSAAIDLQRIQNQLFLDTENGGYYFTSKTSETILSRQKKIYDGAIPSGNSISVLNLLKLSRLTGNIDFENDAIKTIKAFGFTIEENPTVYLMFLSAFEFATSSSHEIVIAGDIRNTDTQNLIKIINSLFIPNKSVLLYDIANPEQIEQIAPYTKNMQAIDGKATVYICKNFSCETPTSDPNEILKLLRDKI